MFTNNTVIKAQELPFQNESKTIYDKHEPKDTGLDPSSECSICYSICEYKLLTLEMI